MHHNDSDTNERCDVCQTELREDDVIDVETGEKVRTELTCPNAWRESHTKKTHPELFTDRDTAY